MKQFLTGLVWGVAAIDLVIIASIIAVNLFRQIGRKERERKSLQVIAELHANYGAQSYDKNWQAQDWKFFTVAPDDNEGDGSGI